MLNGPVIQPHTHHLSTTYICTIMEGRLTNKSLLYDAVELGNVAIHNKFDYFDLNSQQEENFSASPNLSLINMNTTTTTISPPASRDEYLAKIEQSVLAIIFILTIAGNFLVLMGIYLRKQKMTRMYYFIVHLCIADLTTAFFQVLTQLAWEITYRFQGGPIWCKFVKYTQILGPYSSSYILVMTALDRYQAICYPLSNCSWTARQTKVMLVSAWLLSFACCLPQLYIFSYQEISENVFDCWGTFAEGWGEKAYITWYCISVFIIPLIILIFAYSCITRVIWLNFTQKNNAIIQEQRLSSRRVREDSDDVDEPYELDQSIEENNSIYHENCKNSEKMLAAVNGGGGGGGNSSQGPKNLEVQWNPATAATTRMSSSSLRQQQQPPPSSSSCNTDISYNKCQSSNLVDSSSSSPDLDHLEQSAALNTYDSRKNCVDHSHPSSAACVHFQQTPPGSDNMMSKTEGFKSKKQCSRTGSSGSGSVRETPKQRHTWRTVSMSSTTNESNNKQINRNKDLMVMNGGEGSKLRKSLNLSLKNGKTGGHSKIGKNLSSRTLSVRSTAMNSSISQPRTHSVKGISRAKIKTVKLTLTVIGCYILCSTPFIAALLWSAYDPYAKEHPFFYGPTFAILTLLASLNSCANAWIILFFNPNLLQSFMRGTFGRLRLCLRAGQGSGGPSTLTDSQRKQFFNNQKLARANNMSVRPGATSVTGLSPLMSRFSPKREYVNNRLNHGGGGSGSGSGGQQDGMELIDGGGRFGTGGNRKVNVVPLRSSLSARNGNNYPRRDSNPPSIETFIGI